MTRVQYDNVEHYNQAPVECRAIIRHLPGSWSHAVKYLWREGLKDEAEQERGKAHSWLRDAIVNECAYSLPLEVGTVLLRDLAECASYFGEDSDRYFLIKASIEASIGFVDAKRAIASYLESVGELNSEPIEVMNAAC